MAEDPMGAGLGLSEQEVREALEEELMRAMRAEGSVPTVHAIARVLALDHLRMADQFARAGVEVGRVAY